MAYKLSFFIFTSLLFGLIGGDITSIYGQVSSINLYPSSNDGKTVFNVGYKYNCEGYFSYKVILNNGKYSNLLYSQGTKIYRTKNSSTIIALVIAANSLADGVNNFSFLWYCNDTNYETNTYKIKPANRQIIRPEVLPNGSYTSLKDYCSISNLSMIYYQDKLNFFGFDYVIDNGFYYRLSISNLFFSYFNQIENNKLIYGPANLFLYDKTNLFSRLSDIKDGDYRVIPLNINFNSALNMYFITFLTRLFVEPTTFLMSSNGDDGFVPTEFFYLPKNKYSEFSSIPAYIRINNVTKNLNTIEYTFSFDSPLKIFGNCINSKYCIGVNHGGKVPFEETLHIEL